jgi:quinoprotein dehydrogenase-associated probable ABC transporter substrate-binding protein
MNMTNIFLKYSNQSGRTLFALISILILGFTSNIAFAEETKHKERPVLKVCADPELMPLSNKNEEGMENKIAELLAKELGAELEYVWFPQRIGFIRNTLRSEENGTYKCDLVLSVPEHFELAATTKPYYAATYSLVYIKGRGLDSVTEPVMLETLNNERKDIKIGLFDRGPAQLWVFYHNLMDNMVPYQFQMGDPKINPTEVILSDLYDGKFDATIVWGPTAAYYASKNKDRGEMVILPLKDDPKRAQLKFVYNMSMAVRFGDNEWKEQLNEFINKHQEEINDIISSYGIPIVEVVPKPAPEDDD